MNFDELFNVIHESHSVFGGGRKNGIIKDTEL